MIYLIDDKKNRQKNDFGWDEKRFQALKEYIHPIYTLGEVEQRSAEIFQNGNIILYHESFLDNTPLKEEASFRRGKLDEFIKKNENVKLVFFSGSKNVRKIDGNIGYVPVSVLYQNLSAFVEQCSKGSKELFYILYGNNPYIEKDLSERLDKAIAEIEVQPAKIDSDKCLFVMTDERFIQNAIEGADEQTLYFEETDDELSEFITTGFLDKQYNNIFIPLCFGSSLSDFNGLRLAMHIRCTNTPNQLANIFIYGFVELEELMEDPYFDILKTKNVSLVPYKKTAFQQAANQVRESLTGKELPDELKKIKLDVPKSYEDNHSIANEWAIYRWSKHLNIELNDELEQVKENVIHSLYFKYLKTIHPIPEEQLIPEEKLAIKKIGDPKVLLIDDEVEKGWNKLITYLLTDTNSLYSESIGKGFKTMECDEIIHQSMKKIQEEDFDVVILDFRLNEADFSVSDPEETTSVKLLKRIKSLNPGIQVIILSATNKVWNFQSLQEHGADGFITKETPERSDGEFTVECIHAFIAAMNTAIQRIFLKKLFVALSGIQRQINNVEYDDDSDYGDFVRDLKKHLILIMGSAKKINLKEPSSIDIVYLNCYNFMEKFKHHYIHEVGFQQVIGYDELEMNRYKVQGESLISEGKFIRNNKYDDPSWFHSMAGLFLDYFEICTINGKEILNLNKVKEKRNNYIHGSKAFFDRNELSVIVELCLKITSKMRE